MTVVSISSYIDALLRKDLVTPRTKTALGPEIDASNLIGQIALSLYMNPRAALYFILLARNSLASVTREEMSKIEELRLALKDLRNITFSVQDSGHLSSAVASLDNAVQSGSLADHHVETTARAIDKFLQGDIKKNVVGGGLEGMVRPGAEAAADLPVKLAELEALHSRFLSKLYSLVVSLKNFQSLRFSDVQGPTVLNRIKEGILSVQSEAESDPSGYGSRSIVNRLTAYKATLATIAAPPDVGSPLLDSAGKIPSGYTCIAVSDQVAPVASGSVGPFILPSPASITVQDAIGSTTAANIPIEGYDLKNQAHLVAKFPSSYPIDLRLVVILQAATSITGWTSSAGSYWSNPLLGDYWSKDSYGRYSKPFLITASSVANATVLMSSIVSGVGSSFIDVVEYPRPGSGKFCIIAKNPGAGFPSFDYLAVSSQSSFPTGFFSSDEYQLSLFDSRQSSYGAVPSSEVADSIQLLLSDRVSASITASGQILLTGTSSLPGAFLSVSGSAAGVLGLSGITYPTTDTFHLLGSINGSSKNVLNPSVLMGPYDTVTVPTGSASISKVTDMEVVLSKKVRTFSGDITVDSRIVSAEKALSSGLMSYLTEWLNSGYETDLARVDRPVGYAMSTMSQASIGDAFSEITRLSIFVGRVLEIITDPTTMLQPGASSGEVKLAKAILSSLEERKMDAVVGLLLEGKIQEALLSSTDSLSYGSALSKAVSDIAVNDVNFPNRATTDGTLPKAIRRN